MDVVVQLGAIADLSAVLDLYLKAGIDHDTTVALSEAEQWFHTLQRYPNYHLWVAYCGSELVGTFTLLIMDNLNHHGCSSGIVEGVAVAPDYQGKGIGRQMMEKAIALCREAGCYKMALSTNLRRKEAHAFYESLGFEKHGYSYVIEIAS